MNKCLKNIFLSVLAGILGFLAFPPFEIPILGWVCLIPLFIVSQKRKREAFLYSYLAGIVFFGLLLYWFPEVSVPGMIVLVSVLAVFYGLFGLVLRIVFKYSMNVLILPFVWVVLEYIRGNIFTGFPWGYLGYSQYTNTNLVQIADMTGVYGVSFLLVAFNVALFAAFTQPKKRISYMMVPLMFILASSSYGIYRLENSKSRGEAKISVVQGNIPQKFKWDSSHAEEIVETYGALTRRVSSDKADLVVWPETAYPFLVEGARSSASGIADLAVEIKTPILSGIVYSEGGNYYNSAALFGVKGQLEDRYDKTHLVPFGEYIPFKKVLALIRNYIDKPIGDFASGDEYTLFPLRATRSSDTEDGARTRQTSFYKFGVLICFEDTFPYLAREFVNRGANFLINITNDAWFGNTAAARQHMQASVFRAIENRVPVIRAANTGISCFIDPAGRVFDVIEKDGKETFVGGFATGIIKPIYGRTVYTVYGDTFVYFCAFMILLLFVTEGILNRSNSSVLRRE